jgi:DnaJ-domain-containing protein 1
VSIPRRLGRLARGFVLNLREDDRFRETVRAGRQRGETLRDAFGEAFETAWRGAAEEWRTAEEERAEEERPEEGRERREGSRRTSWRTYQPPFVPRRYPPDVLRAYDRLGLAPGVSLEEVNRKRRELVKRYHPDRFSDPGKRARAERVTAEINAAHDAIQRHLLRR